MSASIAYRVLFVIPSALPVIPSAVEESLHHCPEGRALRPFIWERGGAGSSSGSTTTLTGVKIGKASYTQEKGGSKNHIAGPESPMYGDHKGLDKGTNPEVNMNHLAAVVAIKVSNKTNKGPIKVKDVEFSVPTIYEQDELGKIKKDGDGNPIVKTPALAVAGDCDLTIVRDAQQNLSITSIPSNKDNAELIYSTKAILPNAVELGINESITFYLPIRPFSLNGSRQMAIAVNGSSRGSTKSVNFEAGKVTTFNVSVTSLQHETYSDALDVKSRGGRPTDDNSHLLEPGKEEANIIITTATPGRDVIINGQNVKAYVLGSPAIKNENGEIITEGTTGTITIRGFLKDLIQQIPVGFYVSAYDGSPAVMTVNKVTAWLPEYEHSGNALVPTKQTIKKETYKTWLGYEDDRPLIETSTISEAFNFSNLKKRKGLTDFSNKVELTREVLSTVGSLDKITFSNIPNNGYWKNDNSIVLADGYSHKTVNAANINTFLKPFASGNDVATFAGLYKIAMATERELASAMTYSYSNVTTIEYTYPKSYTKLEYDTKETTTEVEYPAWPPKNSGEEGDNTVELDDEIVKTINGIYNRISGITILGMEISKLVVTNKYQLLHFLRDTKVEIELTTTADGPCVVFWGLDVNAEVNN